MTTLEIIAALKELIEEWNEQIIVDLEDWRYRVDNNNNIFNGAVAATKTHILEVKQLISKIELEL